MRKLYYLIYVLSVVAFSLSLKVLNPTPVMIISSVAVYIALFCFLVFDRSGKVRFGGYTFFVAFCGVTLFLEVWQNYKSLALNDWLIIAVIIVVVVISQLEFKKLFLKIVEKSLK